MSAFELVESDMKDRVYYRAQLPNGSWGLFIWSAYSETMEHVDTQPFPMSFDHEPKQTDAPKVYYCSVCKKEPVNALAGFDTCKTCARSS